MEIPEVTGEVILPDINETKKVPNNKTTYNNKAMNNQSSSFKIIKIDQAPINQTNEDGTSNNRILNNSNSAENLNIDINNNIFICLVYWCLIDFYYFYR